MKAGVEEAGEVGLAEDVLGCMQRPTGDVVAGGVVEADVEGLGDAQERFEAWVRGARSG